MKEEARSSEYFKKLAAVKQDRTVYKNNQAGCKVKTRRCIKTYGQGIAKLILKVDDSTKSAGNTI